MNDSGTIWVHPGRITNVEPAPGGQYMVTISSTTVGFAARNLTEERAIIRDIELSAKISNDDTDRVIYMADLACLQEDVRVGAPVMVEIDADDEDEWVIHLYQDALYQEPDLPQALYLVCPAEGLGRWFRVADASVYRCPCGARWDVLPDEDKDMNQE